MRQTDLEELLDDVLELLGTDRSGVHEVAPSMARQGFLESPDQVGSLLRAILAGVVGMEIETP